jgi:hypothetical protein
VYTVARTDAPEAPHVLVGRAAAAGFLASAQAGDRVQTLLHGSVHHPLYRQTATSTQPRCVSFVAGAQKDRRALGFHDGRPGQALARRQLGEVEKWVPQARCQERSAEKCAGRQARAQRRLLRRRRLLAAYRPIRALAFLRLTLCWPNLSFASKNASFATSLTAPGGLSFDCQRCSASNQRKDQRHADDHHQGTASRFSTRTGVRVNRLCSATAGRSRRTIATRRCSFLRRQGVPGDRS